MPHYLKLYSMQYAPHRVRRLFLRRRRDMGVGIQSKAGGEVAQHAGNRFDVHAVLQRQRSEGMAQIVEADGGQPGPLQHAMQHVQNAVR